MPDYMEVSALLAILKERGRGVLGLVARAYLLSEGAAPGPAKGERSTQVVRVSNLGIQADAAAASDPRRRRVYALVRRGPVKDGPVTIGRCEPADVRLELSSVSRVHAAIERQGDAWTIGDSGSKNGTFLDGARLAKGRRERLASSQIVRFGPEARYAFLAAEELESVILGAGTMLSSIGLSDHTPGGAVALNPKVLGDTLPSWLQEEEDEEPPGRSDPNAQTSDGEG